MKERIKKSLVIPASFMVLCLGVSSNCFSTEDHVGAFRADSGLTTEMYFNTKLSDNLTGTATIVNSGYFFDKDTSADINDWSTENYSSKSPVSVNNFYVEFDKDNISGGAGFRTFQEREGLVSALQDIEYQFFPVDATNPLRMKRIGVPGLWGTYHINPDTYLKVVGYDSLWSKISPEAVPDLKHMKLDDPTGDQGFSLFTTLGTSVHDTAFEVGFTRGWGSWPSEIFEAGSDFSPNPYRISAGFFKVRKQLDSWTLGSTALVKNADENAGSVYNMLFSVDKTLSLWQKPVSIGASYFYVQSFEHSEHLRTSPWEDLGNSFSLRAAADDPNRHVRYGLESVINHEEHGYYIMGFTEKWLSKPVKVRSQLDFFYDKQKYISNEHDWIRFAGHFTFEF